MKRSINSSFDLLGIGVSLICAIHCATLPLIITMGLFGGLLSSNHGTTEFVFLSISLVIASFTLFKSYIKHHKKILPVFAFCLGILLIIMGLQLHGSYETILSTLGGMLIASAHILNLRYNRIVY